MDDRANNPYAAPQSLPSAMPYQTTPDGRPIPASRGLRFANLLVDYIGITAFSWIVGTVVGFVAVVLHVRGLVEAMQDASLLFGMLIVAAYYIVLEGTTSKTLGKLVTGTMVVNANGEKPTFGQIVGRSFSRLIPFEAFSFFSGTRRGWHDTLPGTYVVKVR